MDLNEGGADGKQWTGRIGEDDQMERTRKEDEETEEKETG